MRYWSVARNDEISGMWREAIGYTAYNFNEVTTKSLEKQSPKPEREQSIPKIRVNCVNPMGRQGNSTEQQNVP
jgi:hypothetical protein